MTDLLDQLFPQYHEAIQAITIATWDSGRKREFVLSPDIGYAFIHHKRQYGTIRMPISGTPQDLNFLASHPLAQALQREIAKEYQDSRRVKRVKRQIEIPSAFIPDQQIWLIDDVSLPYRIDQILTKYKVLETVIQRGYEVFQQHYERGRAEVALEDLVIYS